MSEPIKRLQAYRRQLREAGFVQIRVWVHGDLAKKLVLERQPGESRAMTLERLLLGRSLPRPDQPPPGSKVGRPGRMSEKRAEHVRQKLVRRTERRLGAETVARLRARIESEPKESPTDDA